MSRWCDTFSDFPLGTKVNFFRRSSNVGGIHSTGFDFPSDSVRDPPKACAILFLCSTWKLAETFGLPDLLPQIAVELLQFFWSKMLQM